ncbi:hypothetical protein L1887_32879 [Cichorium endivia]|nr:hypothetical protein L1887_32879 [Cichorium endivia]
MSDGVPTGILSGNPDAVEAMFPSVKSVIDGSEGRLAFPYQRVGMINAIQELSICPVKLACLTALAVWVARSTDAIKPEVVTFIGSGLEEKESLTRGYLRCLRVICKNADAVLPISSLLVPLIQLVKTGFTKAAQRLDGIYALLILDESYAVYLDFARFQLKFKE